MKQLERERNTPRFVPDYMAKSLLDVDFDELKKRGVKFVAFDADATLVHYRGKALTPQTKMFLQQNRNKFTDWCIASNRITNDLLPLAKSMDAHVIRASWFTRKPSRRFFDWVIKHFGAKPHEIAMIGDKLIADMYGAKKAGLTTVWVERIGKDSKHDTALRVRSFEKYLMRHYVK
jgi:HAD superfamily phosphatase (TIGR01668 family)